MAELLTTKEVAEKYRVSEYTVTQVWVPRGLKHFPSRPFQYRQEWIEEYIDDQMQQEEIKRQKPISTIVKFKPKVQHFDSNDMKLKLEDFI